MENNPKKSRALIITIIIIVILLIVGYLLYKNGNNSSSSNFISRIFSSLSPSDNSKKVTAQAGEDLKKNDQVCSTGTNTDGTPIVMKIDSNIPNCNKVLGTAFSDINNGNSGEIILNSGNAFSDYINNLFNRNNGNNNTNPVVNNNQNGSQNNTIDNTPPDLFAGSVNPQNAKVNEFTTISSAITNIGGTSTNKSFSTLFTIVQIGPHANVELTTIVPELGSRVGNVATVSYKFTSIDTYRVRACADKSSAADLGTVDESNEGNNCSGWTTIAVTSSLPTDGDTCTNGANNPTLCTTIDGNCMNGATNPPDCTTIPTGTTPAVNKCLLIEQNPLTFTGEEKARLAVLLRKFYLISSTLRTEDDITTIYNEIDQQKNFISQISELTNQCYSEYNQVIANGGGGGWVRRGNPWYQKETGGSFSYGGNSDTAYTNYNWLEPMGSIEAKVGARPGFVPNNSNDTWGGEACKVVSGYYYGTLTKPLRISSPDGVAYVTQGSAGSSCDQFNTFPGYGSCTTMSTKINGNDSQPPFEPYLEAGCKWKDGVNLENTERILNIW